jgi:hypothetical protein
LDKSFREGFAALAVLGLTFDAWMFQTQLKDLVDLARAFPHTTIVLNHVGGPLAIGPSLNTITALADRLWSNFPTQHRWVVSEMTPFYRASFLWKFQQLSKMLVRSGQATAA